MNKYTPSRRDLLQTGSVFAFSGLVGSLSAADATENGPLPATIGVSTLGFHEHSNESLAALLSAQGIRNVQLFLNQTDSRYWQYNGRSDTSALSGEQSRAIGETYQRAGINIHSIGVYTNLIHPDEAERVANLTYFDDMMRIGAAMGVHTFITESGHYEPERPTPGGEYRFQEDVWHRMVATGKELAARAERYDATVLMEPYFGSFYASAKRTRLFIEEVDSPRIRVLLDPANLLEINDLEEMFAQLAPWIDCLHAKDRKLHAIGGVAAGEGDIDYDEFVALATKHTPHAPFILEYVGPSDYLAALNVLLDALQRNGRSHDVSPG